MPSSRDESELIVAAQQEIGDAETVLRAGDGAPSRIHETFDRATTTVHTKRFGLSLTLTLEDEAAGTSIRLSGAVARYVAQSGPDKGVLAELAKTA